jgi:N-sulfoglucosamine sulfohydrolase
MKIMLSRRDFIKTAAVTSGFAITQNIQSFAKQTEKNDRPNIILFTADDMGLEIGCYGNTIAKTPNFDLFASEGVRFQTAYVTHASCSPSRCSMLTGLYPHQNGHVGLAPSYSMDKEYLSIPTLLKESGYRTGITGKLHINPASAFDFDFILLNPELNVKKRDVKTILDKTEKFISQSDDPFFLMFNAIDPHRPFSDQLCGLPEKPLVPDEVSTLPFIGVDAPELRPEAAGYYNCVSRADKAFGLLMNILKNNGKDQNTLVIVIGDNGPAFTRAKTTCYEAGLRTPFIIKWGSKFKGGTVRKEMISTVDIMPTVLEAAGVKLPAELSGKSIIRLLKGKQDKWREYLFGEFTAHMRSHLFPRRAVRDQRFKLIHNLDHGKQNPIKSVDGCKAYDFIMKKGNVPEYIKQAYQTYTTPPEFELYDLQIDPHEFNNLAAIPYYQKTLSRLKNALEKWQIDTNDSV